ncbi:MAG: type VI secretion system baseplate subunit TssK [Planctomycetes bacterium]|nr:type VI secretion system baseplate subunit TssK [Planctomycetota bacterium]
MVNTERVVWDEGMQLGPQHFQQWDRHLHDLLRRKAAMLGPHAVGLTSLEVDRQALAGGEFALTAVAGLLADGTVFDAPGRDPLPTPRSFKQLFKPQQDRLLVHLAMPVLCSGGFEVSDTGVAGNQPTPLRRRQIRVADTLRPGAERDLAVAVPNLRLLFDGEPLEDHVLLTLGAVVRSEAGAFALATDHVPTCLHLAASPHLGALLRRVVELLSARSEELGGRQRQTTGMAGAANLWLLHTINTHLPALLDLHREPRQHPRQLFLALSTLAGQLCTFASQQHPRSLPQYDHADLTGTFRALAERLDALLETVIPHRCIPVPLERTGPTLFQARLPDGTLFERVEFFVAVRADVPEDKLIRELPLKAKVSSLDRVQQLVMMAVSGLPLRHVPSPPPEVPVQPGCQYFRLDRTGEHWEAIRGSHTFAFHVPPDFTGLQLELMAIKE